MDEAARWGLKQKSERASNSKMTGVGMDEAARWGLKHTLATYSTISRLVGMDEAARWGLKPSAATRD